jgi:hypothetical protein
MVCHKQEKMRLKIKIKIKIREGTVVAIVAQNKNFLTQGKRKRAQKVIVIE